MRRILVFSACAVWLASFGACKCTAEIEKEAPSQVKESSDGQLNVDIKANKDQVDFEIKKDEK